MAHIGKVVPPVIDSLRTGLEIYRQEGFAELKRTAEDKFLPPLTNRYFKARYGTGVDVMTKDWDTLIILDACRYDVFRDEVTLDGELYREISRGATSIEFIDNNFTGRNLHDTVYVTANPYVTRIEQDVFHAVLTVLDEWDTELQTVMPHRVVERATEAHEDYPNKRLIVHFMQPHQPYIGDKGREMRSKMEDEVDVIGWKGRPQEGIKQIHAPRIDGIDVGIDDVFEAYRENLNIVLSHTESLLDSIDGKTVLTSDHGELIGERLFPFSRRLYGHPGYLWTPELRFVPWFEIESETRRRIISEPGGTYEGVDRADLSAKLRALGYHS